MKIQNTVVIVTGASGGIGLATAKALSNKGATVVLAARSKDKLTQLEKEIPNSFAVVADMRKTEDISNLVKTTFEKYGHIDILVNNAGQGMRAGIEDIKMDDFKDIMELNVFGVLTAMQQVIPIMRTQGGGLILNISSMVSKNYFPQLAAYSATKYALNAITFTAKAELEKDNIMVSAFHPRMTATEFGANARGQQYNSSAGRPGMDAESAETAANAIVEQIENDTAEVMR